MSAFENKIWKNPLNGLKLWDSLLINFWVENMFQTDDWIMVCLYIFKAHSPEVLALFKSVLELGESK